MSEHHDNTKPAHSGSHNLSKVGIVSYLPIQEQDGLRPAMALVLCQRADGEVTCWIIERWGPLTGFDNSTT